MAQVKPIPDGYATVTTSFMFKDSQKAMEFYKKAFGAKVLGVFPNPVGKGIMHAVIQIGDSMVMMGDEMPNQGWSKSAETMGGSPISLFVYVTDVDAAFKRAVEAGGTVMMPVADMFWGDRAGQIKDPFGYQWMIATHTQDLSEAQVRKAGAEFFAHAVKQ